MLSTNDCEEQGMRNVADTRPRRPKYIRLDYANVKLVRANHRRCTIGLPLPSAGAGAGHRRTTALRAVSSEPFIRIDEKREDEKSPNVYLLKLAHFLNDSSTVRGFQNFRLDMLLREIRLLHTTFMQATLSYIGRSEAERNAIHSARAEVKAFF
jgi:hypothetical protein